MSRDKTSFHEWLWTEINGILGRQSPVPPLLLWCDPGGQWLDLLRSAADASRFELWADRSQHELVVRDRFYQTPRAPRIVWLPCSREDITWFKCYELEAESVWEKTLLDALREYGVAIPREQEEDLVSLLPAHAREWFDKPQKTWKELTPGNAKGALVDDHRMLEILAGGPGEFDKLKQEERFAIFVRRAKEDFGLPDPSSQDEKDWRVTAAACLLCTEAATRNPQQPPTDANRVVPPGLPRDNAMKLLRAWQENVYFLNSFEELGKTADATLGLTHWARRLTSPPKSYASREVEETLFRQFTDELDKIDDVDQLSRELAARLQVFKDREHGFWGSQASDQVGWRFLVKLANAASILIEDAQSDTSWKRVRDAIEWYCSRGWHVDATSEELFREEPDLPGQLHRLRARLRRACARATDRIAAAFSELLAHHPEELATIPTAGELVLAQLEQAKGPTALIFLDACRFDLGQRLAQALNEREPVPRAVVAAALAPIPSITSLGMPFALPISHKQLQVTLSPDRSSFRVAAGGFAGNLTIADERRKWLSEKFGVRDFYSFADILDGGSLKRATKSTKLVVINGAEFDDDGHPGRLRLTGADEHLDRYSKAIRRLQESGYNRVIVATDHGFFHWDSEPDEIQSDKPRGELLWASRRAIVGKGLSHASALILSVPGADLEVAAPRSFNAFKTYGGLGYFHGGATLQELVIPVITVNWPAKASKVAVVLKPIGLITSATPRVQIEAAVTDQSTLFGADSKILARRVRVRIQQPSTGQLVFKHDEPVTIAPGDQPVAVLLRLAEPRPEVAYGAELLVQVIDEDDEILAREEVTLKVDLDEW